MAEWVVTLRNGKRHEIEGNDYALRDGQHRFWNEPIYDEAVIGTMMSLG